MIGIEAWQTILNGLGWNLLNVTIMTLILQRSRRRPTLAPA
jgi:hypothetical protein